MGTKTFVLWYRIGGKARRLSLGRFPVLTLAAARRIAREALQDVAQGKDPAVERLRSRVEYSGKLFEAVVSEFVENYAKPHTRSWAGTQGYLKREFVPQWGRWPVQSITRQDVKRVLDAIVARGSPSTANHALAVLRKMLNWSVEQSYLFQSPCVGLKAPSKSRSREHVLTMTELSNLWSAATQMGWPYGRIVQLLILTGQRRNEVTGMRWGELDLTAAIWTIPAERTKPNRMHLLPLSRRAVEVITELPRVHGELVFPAKGSDHPASGFSKWKKKLDELANLDGWVVHDLRRTVASEMARLQVAPHIIERVLNHALPGVAGVYNRFRYLDEMRSALDLWANSLITPHLKPLKSTIGPNN